MSLLRSFVIVLVMNAGNGSSFDKQFIAKEEDNGSIAYSNRVLY